MFATKFNEFVAKIIPFLLSKTKFKPTLIFNNNSQFMKTFLPILFLAMVCTTAVYSQQKVDVWDFGAEQLDPNLYNNMLNTDVINGWYDAGITPGTSGNVLPAFQVGALSWTGGTNDRLRTTNTAFDQV